MCLAIPGKIVELAADDQPIALVDVAGVRRHVNVQLLQEEPPKLGDWVLIHVGFALSKISEQDALDQMYVLAQLGEHQAAMDEVKGYGLENALGQDTAREEPKEQVDGVQGGKTLSG